MAGMEKKAKKSTWALRMILLAGGLFGFAAQNSPGAVSTNAAEWAKTLHLHSLANLLNTTHADRWLFLIAGMAITAWFLRSGDPQRLLAMTRGLAKRLLVPESTASTTAVAPTLEPSATQMASSVRRMTDQEIERRTAGLDGVFPLLVEAGDLASRFHLFVRRTQGTIRDEGVDAYRSELNHIFRNEVGPLAQRIYQHTQSFVLLTNLFPDALMEFGYQRELQEAVNALLEATSRLPTEDVAKSLPLLLPWIERAEAATIQYARWADDARAAVRARREELHG